MNHLGRILQLIALCLLPMGLVAGYMEGDLGFEMKLLGIGMAVFFLGKYLQGNDAPNGLE